MDKARYGPAGQADPHLGQAGTRPRAVRDHRYTTWAYLFGAVWNVLMGTPERVTSITSRAWARVNV